MPFRGRIARRAKEPRDRWWGDPLFFSFIKTLSSSQQEHIEQALQEYFPSQKSHFASYHSTRKYDRPQPVLDRQLWAISKMWTIQHFQAAMGGARLTSPNVYAWSLRPWTTPGFPFVWRWPTKGNALTDDEFWDFYESYKAAEFIWDVLWGSTVKSDELRPPEKIELSELRTFLSSPVHHNVALGEMCADMNARLKDSTATWSTLGRSTFNREWHDIMARLKHPHFFGADLSNQDASMFQEAMLEQAEIRFEMYAREEQTDLNWRRLTNLYVQIVFSLVVLAQGEVVEKDTGNPSGSGNTITDNTMILFRCLAYAWLVLWQEKYTTFDRFVFQDEFRYSCFMANVRGNIIGDDTLLNMSDHALTVYHIRAIVRVMWTLYIVMKPENDEPLSDFQKLSFCSHTTRTYFGTFIPVMEFSRGVASLGWKGASLLHQGGQEVAGHDVHYTLQRALDIRREGFWNDQLFELADSFVRWILNTHSVLLSKPAASGPIAGKSLEGILASYLSEAALIYLYTGKETVVKQIGQAGGLQPEKRCVIEAIPVTSSDLFMPPKSSKKFSQRFHDAVIEPLEAGLDKVTRVPARVLSQATGTHFDPLGTAFHKHVFTEMSSQSKKKGSTKAKRKRNRRRASAKPPVVVVEKQQQRRKNSSKGKPRRRASQKAAPAPRNRPTVAGLGVRSARPRNLYMSTKAGLTMKGGTISGVTEITPDLVIDTGSATSGYVLAVLPLNALAIAPGTRLSDFAALFDQFIFDEAQVILEPDVPYTDSIMLGGGFESDPADALPSVGGFINVKKYMDHQNFHAESLLKSTRAGARFPRNSKAVAKSGRGPRGGMFYNRIPSTAVELSTVQQGWIVVFVHTADQGTFQNSEMHLGPLLLKWRLRLREASERNQYEGQEDLHEVLATGTPSAPFGWNNVFSLQPSLDASSTLEIPVCQSGGSLRFQLPLGLFEVRINIGFATVGAAGYEIDAGTNATYMDILNSDTGIVNSSISAGTSLIAWARVRVKNTSAINPYLSMALACSSTTGYTMAYASARISPIPTGALTFTHSDLRLRSAAWLACRPEGKVAHMVREQLRLLGHAAPEEKKDDSEWQYYLARRNAQSETQKGARYSLRTWEEKEDLESEPEYERVEEPGPVLSSAASETRARSSLKRERDFALFQKLCPQTAEAMLGFEAQATSEKQAEAKVDSRAVERELKWLGARPASADEKEKEPKCEPAPPELSALQKLIGSGWSLVRADPPAAVKSPTTAQQPT
jgi:hypothetical protein